MIRFTAISNNALLEAVKMRIAMRFATLLAVLALFPAISNAQSVYGTVQGTVTDSSGAILPAAEITATEVNTGFVQKTVSNSQGLYIFSSLRPGTYDIVIHGNGFRDMKHTGVIVRIGDAISIDAALSVSGVNSSVEVSSTTPLIRTDDTVVGSVVEEQTIKQLPIANRSAFALALLVPGVQQSSVSNGTSSDSQPRLSGGRARTNEVTMDGTSITDPRRGSSVIAPNLDAIQEFAVITNGIPAQYGRLAGGIITATLKSGTNQFHGNIFEFYSGAFTDARNYFATIVPQRIFNQFGGIIGGPIKKDKLFFFADYQGTRNRAQTIYNITTPTAQELTGNFADVLGAAVGTDALGRTIYKNEIFDPATTRTVGGVVVRDQFPGNAIPMSRWDPAAGKVAALFTQPTNSALSSNYYSLQRGGSNHDQADARVDYQIDQKDLTFVRLSYDRTYSIATRPYPTAGGNQGEIDTFYDSSMAWTHTFSSILVNDVRVGFLRGELHRLVPSTNVDALGIPNLVQEALPAFSPAGYTGIGDSPALDPFQTSYQVTDNMTLVHGKHVISFGFDFRRFSINDLQLTGTTYSFNTLQTSNGTSSNTGNSFASLLLGLPSQYVADTNAGRFYERSNYLGTYIEDAYKPIRNLTLNVGLRYDVEQNPNEVDYNGSNFDLTSGQIITMRQLGTNRVQFTQWHNLGPRLGFAWNPGSKRTVIRGSYGIFYSPLTGRATSAYDRFPKDQLFTLQSANYNPAIVVSQTPAVVSSANGYNLGHFHDDPQANVPYFQQVSFDIQHELPGRVLAMAGYTNSVARHLWMNVQYNQIPIAQVQAAGGGTQSMRPYPNFANVGYFQEGQSTNYNALLLMAQKRYNNGFMLQGSFTWSKFIDVQDDNFSGLYPQDEYNLKAEKGISLANIPTRLVLSGLYDLPFGASHAFLHQGVGAALLGGWQLGAIYSAQGGQQVWVRSANNTSGTFSQLMRPNLTGSPFLSSGRTVKRAFNTAAFSAPASLTFGNSPKSPNIQGPEWLNLDANIHRTIPLGITDKTALEIRAECFNCTNRGNLLPANGQFGSASFGQMTAAQPARQLQFAGKLWF
jgi:hypothetical protein